MREVVYAAAHGGYASERVPLGGGAAIAEWLREEWARTQPFELTLLTPGILGAQAPSGQELTGYGERAYARFCRAFREAATAAILKRDAGAGAVLVNDIAEGPDFAALAARGFRIVTIYHVDVVAYIAALYLRGRIAPWRLTRLWRAMRELPWPELVRLIFDQQEASLRHSAAVIVPSARMKEVLLRCYRGTPEEKIRVVPWGARTPPGSEAEVEARVRALRSEHGVEDDAYVLTTLSRISPEKGQDVLLQALEAWERRSDFPQRPVWLFLCGAPAFMQGRKFGLKLTRLAGRLKRVRVVLPGYVDGVEKRAYLRLGDVYVFPSRHESYGLTLLEALREGCPAVSLDHHGAVGTLQREFGRLVSNAGELIAALKELEGDGALRRSMSAAARAYAEGQRFEAAAARVAAIVTGRE